MTVKELIVKLLNCPLDYKIAFEDEDINEWEVDNLDTNANKEVVVLLSDKMI